MAFNSLLFGITAIIYLSLFINCCDSAFLQGYYWREFGGQIPSDAYPGGIDKNGNPIYIGQILHDNKLITTKIYQNDPKGYYGLLGKEYSATENQKILCTQSPLNFAWVQTKHNQINLLTEHEVILGGHEPGFTMYIGRAFYNLETAIGKVSTGKTENLGLYIVNNGEEINIKSFEILTYNSSYSDSSIVPIECINNSIIT